MYILLIFSLAFPDLPPTQVRGLETAEACSTAAARVQELHPDSTTLCINKQSGADCNILYYQKEELLKHGRRTT